MLTRKQVAQAVKSVSIQGTLSIEDANAVYDMANAYVRLVVLSENYRTMTVLDDADRKRNLLVAKAIDRALEG
jgi:tmRNA-binding protein